MKKYKGLIIIIAITVIYGLVVYFVFNNKGQFFSNDKTKQEATPNNAQSKEPYYLVINKYSYQYDGNKFDKTEKSNIESLYNLKIFVNNKYFGNYKLMYGNTWNIMDDNNEYIDHNGDLIAASTNFNLLVKQGSTREIDSYEKKYILDNYDITTFKDFVTNQVVEVDLDNNGVKDKILCLSYLDSDYNFNNNYNLILVYLNDKYIELLYEKGKQAKNIYNILSVINYLSNINDNIIIEKTVGYIGEDTYNDYDIYYYKNDKYMID